MWKVTADLRTLHTSNSSMVDIESRFWNYVIEYFREMSLKIIAKFR
jgi:hypothetical protein